MQPDITVLYSLLTPYLIGIIAGYATCYLANRREIKEIQQQQRDDHKCLMALIDNLSDADECACDLVDS